MKVIYVNSLLGTDRSVICPKGEFTSIRPVLECDGMGYTVTKTKVKTGGPYFWHYKNHKETCYCIKGTGEVKNLNDGKVYKIRPGVIYILDENNPHEFTAFESVELICIFNPPLKGNEVHKKDGSYE